MVDEFWGQENEKPTNSSSSYTATKSSKNLFFEVGKAHLFIAGQNLHQKLHPEAWGIVYVEFSFHDLVTSVKDLLPKGLMNLFTNYLVIGFFCGTEIFSPTLIFLGSVS
jgi:hypothetical protein